MKTTDVVAGSRGLGTCKGCGRAIEWVEFARSGKRAPFDAPLEVLGRKEEDGRQLLIVDLEKSHFGTCPKSKEFSRKGKR